MPSTLANTGAILPVLSKCKTLKTQSLLFSPAAVPHEIQHEILF